MNKQIIIFGLLFVSIFFNIIPLTAVAAQDNPYSFHWWYKQYSKQVSDTDNHDDNDDKKHSSKKHSKQSSSEERLDKKFCANSGTWNGKKCIIDDPVEKAAYEDAVCDEPSDSAKYSSVCGGSEPAKDDDKKTDSKITVKPVVVEKQTIDLPGYFESKQTQDLSDDDPTTAEYKEKVIKFDSERSQEEKKQSQEQSFYDDDYDKSNDNSRNDDDDGNDDTDDYDSHSGGDSDDSSNGDDNDSDSNDSDDDGSSSDEGSSNDKDDKEN